MSASTLSVGLEDFLALAVEFDYIIVGGGTAGFPLAVRLAETPGVRVGVLEAGTHFSDSPELDQPRYTGIVSQKEIYTWQDTTSPIPSLDGRAMPAPRGKMLGGSSGINYLAWDRGSRAEYDAWARFGGADVEWSFDALLPYFKKSEDASSIAANSYIPDDGTAHDNIMDSTGARGPVKLAYNDTYTDVQGVFVKTWNTLGVPTRVDYLGGDKEGVVTLLRAVDFEAGKRMTSASAYLPLANPKQVHVLLEAQATKIVLDEPNPDNSGLRAAASVEFLFAGKVHTVRAKKEIILCTGSLRSPALLEMSGIGDARRLQSLGIAPLIDLPGVGENLQDQVFLPVQYRLKPGVKTKDLFRNDPEFVERERERYEKTKRGWFTLTDASTTFLPLARVADPSRYELLLAAIDNAAQDARISPMHRAQYFVQLEQLKAASVPTFEFMHFAAGAINPEPGEAYTVMLSGLLTPFSRGSVHIAGADPLAPLDIQPNYLSHELDMDMCMVAWNKLEEFAQTAPWSGTAIEADPPLPPPEHLYTYFRAACLSSGHLVGSAAMAPLEMGGVVGGDFKVHGTRNLRVVDASVFPTSLAAHTQATVYALAEKAADVIKNGA